MRAFLGEERNRGEAFKDQNVCPKGIYRPVRQERDTNNYSVRRKCASGWRAVCVDVCGGDGGDWGQFYGFLE